MLSRFRHPLSIVFFLFGLFLLAFLFQNCNQVKFSEQPSQTACPADQHLENDQCVCNDSNRKVINGICIDDTDKYPCMKSIADTKLTGLPPQVNPDMVDQVRYSYCLVFARDPADKKDPVNPGGDLAGLYFWQESMTNAKMSLEDAIRELINKKEFKDRLGPRTGIPALTVEQLVEVMYQALLQRGVVAGDTWWKDEINKYIKESKPCPSDKYLTEGLPDDDVKNKFCAFAQAVEAFLWISDPPPPPEKWNEFRKVQFNVDGKPKNIANSIDLFYLYFLGEEPLLDVKKRDTYFLLPGERGIYNSRIAKHYWDATPLHIARILTEHYVSPEGIKRLGSLTTYDLTTIPIDILVTDMYNRFYRRNPDPSGQAYWVEQFIQQGLDRDSRLTKWPGVIKNFVHHKELLESHLQLQKPQAFNW